jgi:hypothetical protein
MTGRDETRKVGLGKVLTIVVPLILLLPLGLVLQGEATAQSQYREMIDFSHRPHVAAGVQCLFCHPNAMNGQVAGIPSAEKCVGCHQSIQVTTDAGKAQVEVLLRLWQSGQPLLWPSIVDMPDFVYFAHRPHIAAGKSCENCHGDVGQMAMARQAKRINMGFCLNNCHRHQDPVRRERLMACATCHQ